MIVPVQIRGRELRPHKAHIGPSLGTRTVLTHSPWEFVSLWLKREKKVEAGLLWSQARTFADAAANMPMQSAPLLHYYCFMNAAKALLVSKGLAFNPYHGVGAHDMRGASKKIELANEGVQLKNHGVLPSLSGYFAETEPSTKHSLKAILFNIPWVHRTYCLTYLSQDDLFVPLTEPRYVLDDVTGNAYFSAKLSKDFADRRYMRRLPASLVKDSASTDPLAIRSASAINLAQADVTALADITALAQLHKSLRFDLQYIHGTQTLWYVKTRVKGPARLNRSPMTLALAAMHRLSEICRYKPVEWAAFLAGQQNWLLTEFVQMTARQYVDQIASELTGHQFMDPNVRAAT